MMRYNQNKGQTPRLDDRVMIIYTMDNVLDGLYGIIGGFSDIASSIACVILDEKLSTGESIVCMPVVCLDFIAGTE